MSFLALLKRRPSDVMKMYVLEALGQLIKSIGEFIKQSHERGDKSFMVSFREQMDSGVLHAHGSFFLYRFSFTR
jgi:hypothetical protein